MANMNDIDPSNIRQMHLTNKIVEDMSPSDKGVLTYEREQNLTYLVAEFTKLLGKQVNIPGYRVKKVCHEGRVELSILGEILELAKVGKATLQPEQPAGESEGEGEAKQEGATPEANAPEANAPEAKEQPATRVRKRDDKKGS